jgi:hypothetical protein
VVKRKPILLLDKSDDSIKAIDLFKKLGIDYVEYDIKKFEEGCCGELEGIFKGLEKINEYISLKRNNTDSDIESESAYW